MPRKSSRTPTASPATATPRSPPTRTARPSASSSIRTSSSIPSTARMFPCVDCHKDVKSLAHDTPPAKITCAQCHADAQAAYAHSMHAQHHRPRQDARSHLCQTATATRTASSGARRSQIARQSLPTFPPPAAAATGKSSSWSRTAKARSPSSPTRTACTAAPSPTARKKAAVCTDCHGAHEILPANEAAIAHLQIQRAGHLRQVPHRRRQHLQRQHSRPGHRARQQLAPVCTDCHGIHSIKSHTDPNSPVAEQNLSRDTCARCHEGVRLSQEFGVPGNRVTSYFDSYHGLAAEGGSVVAANCSSCHGVHDILPSSDPRSTINPRQSRRHLRQVPQGRHAEVHAHAGPPAGRRRTPTTSIPSPCAGCAGSTFRSSCSSSAPCSCTTPSSGAARPSRAAACMNPYDDAHDA